MKRLTKEDLDKIPLQASSRWSQDRRWAREIDKIGVGEGFMMPAKEWRALGYKGTFSCAVQGLFYASDKKFKVRREAGTKNYVALRIG